MIAQAQAEKSKAPSTSIPALDRSDNYAKLRRNFVEKIMSNLRVLTSESSSTFITGVDLALEIAKKAEAPLTAAEIEDLKNSVCTNLYTLYDNKARSNVFRSVHRMIPRAGGRSSFGYRFGAAINVPYRDTDQIRREKEALNSLAVTHENFDTVFKDAMKSKSVSQLQDYMMSIMAEIEARHVNLQIRNAELGRENEELKNRQENVKKDIEGLAQRIHGIVPELPREKVTRLQQKPPAEKTVAKKPAVKKSTKK